MTTQVQSLITQSLALLDSLVTSFTTKLDVLERLFLQELRPVRRLITIYSGPDYTSVGAALCARFHHVFSRLSSLESRSDPSSSLGQHSLPPFPSSFQTEIAALKTELVLTRSDLNNLIASLGEKSVTIGGVRFESRGQIISWVRSNIPSEAYDIFYDVVAH